MKKHARGTRQMHKCIRKCWKEAQEKYRKWKEGKTFFYHLLASQSDAHRIAPLRDPIQPNPRPRPIHPLIALKPERHMMWYIFGKEIVQGPQKQCSQVSDTQIHKYKYTNTQYTNTVLVKLSDTPIMWYISEKVMVQCYISIWDGIFVFTIPRTNSKKWIWNISSE